MALKTRRSHAPRKFRIVYATAEAFPFVKVGGLADVAGALPKALAGLGHDVYVVLPKYAQIDEHKFGLTEPLFSQAVPMAKQFQEAHFYQSSALKNVQVLFVANDTYFGREHVYGYDDDDARFLFFSKSVVKALPKLRWPVDIVHCNDWHTAMIPSYLLSAASQGCSTQPASVFTIHNLAYQGPFTQRTLALLGTGSQDLSLNLTARGILVADMINTVSAGYAREIMTPEYGVNMDAFLRARSDRLCGILNGVDYEEFDPGSDPYITTRYSEHTLEKRRENKLALQRRSGFPCELQLPLVGMVCRLDDQKGLPLIIEALRDMMACNVQFVAMGVGNVKYERLLKQGMTAYPQHFAYHATPDEGLARAIYAGCDLLLCPSSFEPCGLGPLIGLRYGAISVVRRTGGLAETIPDYTANPQKGLGFTFEEKNPEALLVAIRKALMVYRNEAEWQTLIKRAMKADYSWDKPAKAYETLYHNALNWHARDWRTDVRAPSPVPAYSDSRLYEYYVSRLSHDD